MARNSDDLWTTAAADSEQETAERLFTAARIEAAQYWPLLAAADTEDDFINRMSMVEHQLDRVTASVLDEDTQSYYPQLRARLSTELATDFAKISNLRKDAAVKRTARLQAEAREELRRQAIATVKKGKNGYETHCDACRLQPMTGLTYEGATNLASTHNKANHGTTAFRRVAEDGATTDDPNFLEGPAEGQTGPADTGGTPGSDTDTPESKSGGENDDSKGPNIIDSEDIKSSGAFRTAAVEFQRRHYQHIADGIKSAPVDDETREALARHFADHLAGTNPNFDRSRFIGASTHTASKVSRLDFNVWQTAEGEPLSRTSTLRSFVAEGERSPAYQRGYDEATKGTLVMDLAESEGPDWDDYFEGYQDGHKSRYSSKTATSVDDAYRAGQQDAWDGEPRNTDFGDDMADYHDGSDAKELQQQYNEGYRDFKAGNTPRWVSGPLASLHTAADPGWIENDPDWWENKNKGGYGMPNSHPFWKSTPYEDIGQWRVFDKDGTTYGYNRQQNAWLDPKSTSFAGKGRQAVVDYVKQFNEKPIDIWATRRAIAAYSPFSDPQSAYNNPDKGPHKGTPDDLFPDGVPLHGDLTPEQEAWLHKRSGFEQDQEDRNAGRLTEGEEGDENDEHYYDEENDTWRPGRRPEASRRTAGYDYAGNGWTPEGPGHARGGVWVGHYDEDPNPELGSWLVHYKDGGSTTINTNSFPDEDSALSFAHTVGA